MKTIDPAPETLSPNDIVSIVKDVFGISVQLLQVSDQKREADLISAGVPAPAARHLFPRRQQYTGHLSSGCPNLPKTKRPLRQAPET